LDLILKSKYKKINTNIPPIYTKKKTKENQEDKNQEDKAHIHTQINKIETPKIKGFFKKQHKYI